MVSRSWKFVTSFKVLFHVAYTGPCPPCPKTVFASCHCGSQAPVLNLGRVESLVESYFLVASTAVSLHAGKKTVCYPST